MFKLLVLFKTAGLVFPFEETMCEMSCCARWRLRPLLLDSCSGQSVHEYRRCEPEVGWFRFEATVDAVLDACCAANEDARVVDGSEDATAVLRLWVRLLVRLPLRKRFDEEAGEPLDGERWPLELPGDSDG